MAEQLTANDEIRQAVRERYAQAAESVGEGQVACCGPSDATGGSCGCGTDVPDACEGKSFGSELYSINDRDELPDAAKLASWAAATRRRSPSFARARRSSTWAGGGSTSSSARRVGSTGKAYGVDMTDEMLELARRNQREAGVENVEFLKGTIEKVPPDDSVDVIISNCVINLSADKPSVFREAARVLRPGGRFAVTDIVADADMDKETRRDMAQWTGCIAARLTEDEPWSDLERRASSGSRSARPTGSTTRQARRSSGRASWPDRRAAGRTSTQPASWRAGLIRVPWENPGDALRGDRHRPNTTRLLVAEPQEGQLRKVMEQRAYTRIGKGASKNGKITAEKIAEVAEVVTTQVRLAHEMGAEVIKTVATAAIREAKNRDKVVKEIEEAAGVEVSVLDEEEEGRLAFIGATKSLGHPVEGKIAVVDVGGGSSEIVYGTLAEGVTEVKSFKIGPARSPRTTWNRTRRRRRRSAPSRPHLGFLRGRRVRAARPGGGGRRERDLAAHAGRGGARVRDARAGGPRPLQRRDRRRRKALRAFDSRRVKLLLAGVLLLGEVLADARPAAADRQGRPPRGDHPDAAQRQPGRLPGEACGVGPGRCLGVEPRGERRRPPSVRQTASEIPMSSAGKSPASRPRQALTRFEIGFTFTNASTPAGSVLGWT